MNYTPSDDYRTYSFRVTQGESLVRLDNFLAKVLPEFSRSFFKRLTLDELIEVNSKPAKSSLVVKEGDTVTVKIPLYKTENTLTAEINNYLDTLSIAIIYENDDFLIINKPAGLLTHKLSATSQEPTLVDWLTRYKASIKHVGVSHRPGIVHRLDKGTSGLMIIALTSQAHELFTTLFMNRLIKKNYTALVEGAPDKEGLIDMPLGRDPFVRTKMSTKAKTVRKAVTRYNVIEYFPQHSLVNIETLTGRTHQIRVHFSSLGYPLVGDVLYGKASHLTKHHALHATSLSFTFKDKLYVFTSEIPHEFAKLLESVRECS